MFQRKHAAFTLTELLVAIGIIVILVGILVPVIMSVRKGAYAATTSATISALSSAFENYHTDFKAYPGPLSNDQIYTLGSIYSIPQSELGPANGSALSDRRRITQNENSVLGLLGGLRLRAQGDPAFRVIFDKDLVGKGPRSLNSLAPKQSGAYMTDAALSKGHFFDEAGDADDTEIPEFVDKFPSPLPIIVIRQWPGRTVNNFNPQPDNNAIITDGSSDRPGPMDISQYIAYTGAYSGVWPNLTRDPSPVPGANSKSIGVGKDLPEVCQTGDGNLISWKGKAAYHGLNGFDPAMRGTVRANDVTDPSQYYNRYYYPYEAYAYFVNRGLPIPTQNPNNTNVIPTPKQKGRFILISAGKDRVYGTDDDIVN